MSNAPILSQGAAQASVKRGSTFATTAAYYVTRTTQRPTELEGTPETRAAAIEAFRGKHHLIPSGPDAICPTDHELAAKGAMASLRHPPEIQDEMTTEKLISSDGVGFSRAGSVAALRSARDRSETLDSRDMILEETLGQDQSSRKAATGAMATSHKRLESASIQEELPDLTQAMSAANTSHRVVREEETVVETVEPAYDPAKIHEVAIARTRDRLSTTNPSQSMPDETTKKNTQQAAAVTMAKQMYAARSQPRNMASTDGPQNRTAMRMAPNNVQPVDLMSVAQKRVSARLAQMDAENAPMMMYRSPRTSMPASEASPMVRRESTASDAETSSFTRSRPQRTRFRSTMRERTNDIGAPVEEKEEDILMKRAQQNAKITLDSIDHDVYMRSGRPPPTVLRRWEREVNERAMAVKAPPTSTFVPMQGSRFEDSPHVQAIARSRLQPRLAEIDDRVYEKRASALERQLDEEHERWYRSIQKEREAETMRANATILEWMRQESQDNYKTRKQRAKKEAKERARAEKALAKQRKKAEKRREAEPLVNGTTADRQRPLVSQAEPAREPEPLPATEQGVSGPVREEEATQQRPVSSTIPSSATPATSIADEELDAEPEPTPVVPVVPVTPVVPVAPVAPVVPVAPVAPVGPVAPVAPVVPVVPVIPQATAAPVPESTPAEAEVTQPRGPSPTLPETTAQWSTSDEEEAGGSVLVEPSEPTPAVPTRSPKRFNVWNVFSRSSPRDTGKQGSFQVQKPSSSNAARDTIEDGVSDVGPSVQPAEASLPESQPGAVPRSSKFQEIL